MRAFVWILLIIALGCRQASDVTPTASQFIGSWISPSAPAVTAPYTHWTFNANYVYSVADTAQHCRPVESQPSQYWVEENVLVTRYAGITNGLFPLPDVRRPIVSLSATEIVLDSPRQVLQRCP